MTVKIRQIASKNINELPRKIDTENRCKLLTYFICGAYCGRHDRLLYCIAIAVTFIVEMRCFDNAKTYIFY